MIVKSFSIAPDPTAENQQWPRKYDADRSNAQSCKGVVKGTRAKACPKCDHQFNSKQKAAPAPEPTKVVVEKPTKVADAVTIAQIRAVAELVTSVGGSTAATSCCVSSRNLGFTTQ